MTFEEVNPGDIIKIKESKRWLQFLDPVMDKEIPVHHVDVFGSCPEFIIVYENGYTYKDGSPKTTVYGLSNYEVEYLKHNEISDKRWNWIWSGDGIGKNNTLYDSPIRKDTRYRYMWQRYDEKQGYYVCPFCGKKLNPINKIDVTTSEDRDPDYVVKECDCEGWKAREKKYSKMLDLQKKIEKIENEILEGTSLEDLVVPYEKKEE